jgi:hypothetical protein
MQNLITHRARIVGESIIYVIMKTATDACFRRCIFNRGGVWLNNGNCQLIYVLQELCRRWYPGNLAPKDPLASKHR